MFPATCRQRYSLTGLYRVLGLEVPSRGPSYCPLNICFGAVAKFYRVPVILWDSKRLEALALRFHLLAGTPGLGDLGISWGLGVKKRLSQLRTFEGGLGDGFLWWPEGRGLQTSGFVAVASLFRPQHLSLPALQGRTASRSTGPPEKDAPAAGGTGKLVSVRLRR